MAHILHANKLTTAAEIDMGSPQSQKTAYNELDEVKRDESDFSWRCLRMKLWPVMLSLASLACYSLVT